MGFLGITVDFVEFNGMKLLGERRMAGDDGELGSLGECLG